MKALIKRKVRPVAFDAPTSSADGYGGTISGWTEAFTDRAEFIHPRGGESEQAGRPTGTGIIKVKLWSSANSRAVTTEHRMRDTQAGVSYNVRHADTVTDRRYVWLTVERGVAI